MDENILRISFYKKIWMLHSFQNVRLFCSGEPHNQPQQKREQFTSQGFNSLKLGVIGL